MNEKLYQQWLVLSEKIKDHLTDDICAEIGLHDFDTQVAEKAILGRDRGAYGG